MSDLLLDIRALGVSLRGMAGTARILDRIDLQVAKGEVVGVVGESGCGKSTLVRTLLGILPQNALIEGSARFDGLELAGLPESTLNASVRGRRIGFIPQDPYLSLNPVFTVGAQILEIMRWHAPEPRREHRANLIELLRKVRLPDPEQALERYPHQFSGGQRQRLLIAAALTCHPALIIADEPTTALDVTTQREILDLLRELVRETGASMLFVTHDLGVVAQLCDRVCVMYAGQTVEVGESQDTFANPLHPYTRALLACHPERAESFVGIPGVVPAPTDASQGCRFEPRCASRRPGCHDRPPRFVGMPNGRQVNCILYEERA
jgi:oligopeptide/dipeptide ABC transporter ATP-binding protein